jgi:hypothetical protein
VQDFGSICKGNAGTEQIVPLCWSIIASRVASPAAAARVQQPPSSRRSVLIAAPKAFYYCYSCDPRRKRWPSGSSHFKNLRTGPRKSNIAKFTPSLFSYYYSCAIATFGRPFSIVLSLRRLSIIHFGVEYSFSWARGAIFS